MDFFCRISTRCLCHCKRRPKRPARLKKTIGYVVTPLRIQDTLGDCFLNFNCSKGNKAAIAPNRMAICRLLMGCSNKKITVHWRASGPLWRAFGILWLCYFAWRAEKWAKQTNWLPISAIHKQPPLILGGQKRRRRGPEARQSTVFLVDDNWVHISEDTSRQSLIFFFRPTAVHPLTATVRSLLPVFTLRSRLRSWLAKNLLPQASPKLFFQDPTHTQTSKWVTIKSWWSNPKAAIIPQKLPHQY